jgi:DNA-binding CsgD family transcriptional regulator
MADGSAGWFPSRATGVWRQRQIGDAVVADLLNADDYVRILVILEVVERAGTVAEFRRMTFEAVDHLLGWRRRTFFVGGPPGPGLRPDGSTHSRREPIEQCRPVEDFVLRRASSQLSLWLDTGTPAHGYLSIFDLRGNEVLQRARAVLLALRPHLAYMLRSVLLDYQPVPGAGRLSSREAEIARLVSGGWSNRDIGLHLGVAEDTVKKHLSHVMRKLELRNRTQVALLLSPRPG